MCCLAREGGGGGRPGKQIFILLQHCDAVAESVHAGINIVGGQAFSSQNIGGARPFLLHQARMQGVR